MYYSNKVWLNTPINQRVHLYSDFAKVYKLLQIVINFVAIKKESPLVRDSCVQGTPSTVLYRPPGLLTLAIISQITLQGNNFTILRHHDKLFY